MSGDLNHQGTDKLRRGRVSIPGARYFTTFWTQGRELGLSRPEVAEVLIEELRGLHCSSDIHLFSATIMPEHVHVLFELGRRLSLAQVHAKYKFKTRGLLAAAGLGWQGNYFDHRLREQVPMEQFARYIYLNPYRKQLLSVDAVWPYWVLHRPYTPEFVQHLIGGVTPPLEWLKSGSCASELVEADYRLC